MSSVLGGGIVKNIPVIIFFALLFIILIRFSISFKIKRIIRLSENMKNNPTNKKVKKYIAFLRGNTLIHTPEVVDAMRKAQLAINEDGNIKGKLKLDLYNILVRKRIEGVQKINPVYVDKDGNRIKED